MQRKERLHILILRNNLRTKDNQALNAALNAAKRAKTQHLLAIFSTEILEGSFLSHETASVLRKEVTFGAVLDLRASLEKLNISLYITDSFEHTLQSLAKEFSLILYISQEVGTQERALEQQLCRYEHRLFFEQTMIEPFVFDYTKSFSHFRNRVIATKIKAPEPEPKPLQNNTRAYDIAQPNITKYENLEAPFTQKSAAARVVFYLKNHLYDYEKSRWFIDGEDISTHFSPYLSLGIISPKSLHKSLREAEANYGASSSSAFIFMELLWRDFFHHVMRQSHNQLFLSSGFGDVAVQASKNQEFLERFYTAQTDEPLINAGIKELRLSGWLSNRMRQLLANYFCRVLGLDFRYGAAFFQTYLIDYNPAANWGNWAYQAGVGNDKRGNVFDIAAQSARYGGAAYIEKWRKKEL